MFLEFFCLFLRIYASRISSFVYSFSSLSALQISRIFLVALLIRGVLSIYVYLLDGRPMEEIAQTSLDFMEKTTIKNQLSVDRFSVLSELPRWVIRFCKESILCMNWKKTVSVKDAVFFMPWSVFCFLT